MQKVIGDSGSKRDLLSTLWTYIKRCIFLVMLYVLRCGPIPKHVTFILDGHRRYARSKGFEVNVGHHLGHRAFLKLLPWLHMLGVESVTVFTFSLLNYGRSAEEVNYLMKELDKFFVNVLTDPVFMERGFHIDMIGELELMDSQILRNLAAVVHKTNSYKCQMRFVLAMPYTSQTEICNTVEKIQKAVKAKRIHPQDVTEDLIDQCLYTRHMAAPELSIRTGGVTRLSDYLLWQCVKRSLIRVSKRLCPELGPYEFFCHLFQYQRHLRRNPRKTIPETYVPLELSKNVLAFISSLNSEKREFINMHLM